MSRIVIVAFGSRGDVAPYTGLGIRLRQAGHAVAVAACRPYADLVTEAGLEYRWLPKDPREGARSEAGRRYMEDASARARRNLIPELVEGMRGVGPAIAEAARDADLLLCGVIGSLMGYHVAEGLGIPSAGVFLLPTAPTGDFPPVVTGTRSLGRWGNRAAARLGGVSERIFLPQVNELRAQLGLPATTRRGYQRRRNAEWPILHGFSEHLVPRPADWRAGLEITGYWWPEPPRHWEPPARLVDFLAAGPPPVFVGFGSSAITSGERFSEIVSTALRTAGVRGVVQAGWAGLEVTGDDVITIGEAPYPWLFPRMAAVVHHAGAGTTAAGLHAGVPAVAVPGIVDQPFWAKRLVHLGLAPDSIRQRDLDADRLAAAITAVVSEPAYRRRTQQISAAVRAEDGAGRVVTAVTALLKGDRRRAGNGRNMPHQRATGAAPGTAGT